MANFAPLPVDYTSKDYAALRADLVKLVRERTGVQWQADDPNDFGVLLLEAFAYMGDVVNYYLDRAANEAFIDTATQRQSLLNLATLFGYRPSGPTPATLDVKFTNRGSTPIDLPAGTQVMAPLQYGNYSEVFFETTTAVTQLAAGESVTIKCLEGKTANTDRPDLIDPATNTPIPVVLGSSTGTPNMEYKLPDGGVLDNSVRVFVGQGAAFTNWGFVDSLIEWGPFDQVYTTRLNPDGSTSVVFGDGINGSIPTTGQLISSLYRTSIGAAGNIIAGQIVEVSFIPGNTSVNAPSSLAVENAEQATGGADADTTAQIRYKLKKAIQTRRRAITLMDYEALALLVPKIGRTKASSSVYSTVNLYVQPQNDFSLSPGVDATTGTPTDSWLALADDVKAYFADKIPVNTTLNVQPPTYVDVVSSIIVNVASAYKQDDVKLAVAAALLDSRTGLFSYNRYGFGATVAFSDVIQATAPIPGVVSVTVSELHKLGEGPGAGDIVLAANEIPRLISTNLELVMQGGLI